MNSFTRISVALPNDLVDDIYFELVRQHGKIMPKDSVAKYLYEKLRPIVPNRKIQVVEGDLVNNGSNSGSD